MSRATGAAALIALSVLGAAVSFELGHAAPAAALDVPGLTIPGVVTIAPTTVSVPLLPTTTPATTTTGGATTTGTTEAAATVGVTQTNAVSAPATPPSSVTAEPVGSGSGSTTTAGDSGDREAAGGTALAGARRLGNGVVSIPVSSVRAPARLRILVAVAPHVVRAQTRAIAVRARIVDTRGYVVRGARVSIAGRRARKTSAVDGLVGFTVRGRFAVRSKSRIVLVLRAADPAAPKAANAVHKVLLPVRKRK